MTKWTMPTSPSRTPRLRGTLANKSSERSKKPTESYSQSPLALTATMNPSLATSYLAKHPQSPNRPDPRPTSPPQKRDHTPRPHRRCDYCLSHLETERITQFFSDIPAQHLPPENSSSSNSASYYKSSHSPSYSTQLIRQHCPRTSRSKDRRSAPHTIPHFRCSHELCSFSSQPGNMMTTTVRPMICPILR